MASVLIVEDEPSIQNAYSFILSKRGFDIAAADNVQSAIGLAHQKSFDAIILDLLMPSLSGLDFLRMVKPKESMPQTKILILSNTESTKIVHDALELSGGEYILKVDCTPAEVADKITAMISSSELPASSAPPPSAAS